MISVLPVHDIHTDHNLVEAVTHLCPVNVIRMNIQILQVRNNPSHLPQPSTLWLMLLHFNESTLFQ